MSKFHLFQDQSGQVLAVEAVPEALQRAPKNRLIKRMARELVAEERATMALQMFGGLLVRARQPVVQVSGRYEF